MKDKTLHERLVEIQQTLKAPKGQYNDFSKFYYRSCEDILEAVKPLLKGLSLILQDDMVNIGAFNYVKATVELRDGSGEVWSASAFARESIDRKGMDDAQITGSASSYARKYALNGLFAIDDTKDADSMDNTKKVARTAPQGQGSVASADEMEKSGLDKDFQEHDYPDWIKRTSTGSTFATDKQVNLIQRLLKGKAQSEEDLKLKYKVENINALPLLQASQIIDNLIKLPDKEVILERQINEDLE